MAVDLVVKPGGEDPEVVLTEGFDVSQVPEHYQEQYFTHLLCHSGSGQFEIGGKTYRFGKQDIVFWLPAAGVSKMLFSPDFKATYLFLSFDLMSRNNPDISWGIKAFLFAQENPVVHLSGADFKACHEKFKAIYKKQQDTSHHFHREVLDRQTEIFVMDMWNLLAQEIQQRAARATRGSLFERFLGLVQEHCMEEREVEFYAKQLCITSKYLTEICKKNSGKTAKEWIQNYTNRRLIFLLKDKSLTLTEIADTLNFSGMSFFSRYVKKALGVSPTAYREKLV